MRVAILATFCVLLHIIGIPWYKTLAGIFAIAGLCSMPEFLNKRFRRW